MKTDEYAKPPPKAVPKSGWARWVWWHRYKRHKVGSTTTQHGGLWDGITVTVVSCFTCDLDWKMVSL